LNIIQRDLPGVLLLELTRHEDDRGWFLEFWNPSRIRHPDLPERFVQDNIAYSHRGVLRGLHFQIPNPQGKLVTVTNGEIYDVAVDVRTDSATFGQWSATTIVSGRAVYVPEGFAHGYQVVSDSACVLYKCTDCYHPDYERSLAWNDPQLAISWPIADARVSPKDGAAPTLAETYAALTKSAAVR